MNTSDVRKWIIAKVFKPLRGKGVTEVKLRAGSLHNAIGIKARMPMVCSAMRSVADDVDGIKLIKDGVGPKIKNAQRKGANVWCTYRFVD